MCTGMQQLQMYQTDEPYNEATGKNDRNQTERDNQDGRETQFDSDQANQLQNLYLH